MIPRTAVFAFLTIFWPSWAMAEVCFAPNESAIENAGMSMISFKRNAESGDYVPDIKCVPGELGTGSLQFKARAAGKQYSVLSFSYLRNSWCEDTIKELMACQNSRGYCALLEGTISAPKVVRLRKSCNAKYNSLYTGEAAARYGTAPVNVGEIQPEQQRARGVSISEYRDPRLAEKSREEPKGFLSDPVGTTKQFFQYLNITSGSQPGGKAE